MRQSGRLKTRLASESKTLKSPGSAESAQTDYPVFCFRHIVDGYKVDSCEDSQKAALLNKLEKMSNQSWQELMTSSHWSGAGFEHMPVTEITTQLPTIITEDVSKLLVMRFSGTSHRLIGHRRGGIFHITHIDVALTAYRH